MGEKKPSQSSVANAGELTREVEESLQGLASYHFPMPTEVWFVRASARALRVAGCRRYTRRYTSVRLRGRVSCRAGSRLRATERTRCNRVTTNTLTSGSIDLPIVDERSKMRYRT